MLRAASAALALLAIAALVAYRRGYRRADQRARFFTPEQKRIVGEAWGANCVWRPCHWLPLAGLLAALWRLYHDRDSTGWWAAVVALAVLTGTGTPVGHVGRCKGLMTGGHQQAHSRNGTTSIWNCEPCCGRHGSRQSNTHSLAYACRFGPVSLVPYLVRAVIGNVCLMAAALHEPITRR